MRRLVLAALMLMIASVCFASSADENFHSGKNERTNLFHADKSGDKELQSLIAQYVPKFTLSKYSDDVTGLELPYSVYLPDGYSEGGKFPVVFFIADGSSAGKEPQFSLTQGLGGLIWCRNDCIVIVPAYPEIVLDDHNGFVESAYVELTARFVKWAVKNYSVDESRVYATGQSMGCMTWLVLAARYPELLTASMFVSGQWDINALKGLLTQKFVYIASAGDPKASAGMNEVIEMFRSDGENFTVEKNVDAKKLDVRLIKYQPVNFVMFKKGTTLPDSAEGEYSEHMTSFDYAYKAETARNWLLSQTRRAK
ncbi:MAG: hypothetical protein II876_10215 [Synergistaceae bacterium]|nr:hypothetical protein [Synergistaceae bacterium]MBR0248353.1 hypothetical protein [Synergistaceae bacterium]